MSVGAFLGALGLLIAVEGLVYFAFPGAVRRVFAALLAAPEATFRRIGLGAASLGVVLVIIAATLG
ncbi:DUF2065 domain-containing protein [Elioraea sp.]|uniref:DUF2065 domain-containing protein n=1 Tax=Elioraea sp. TaxID=2185103 RepID=UPI0025B7DBD9|nr:DUF2065 domain-containing protein [Elioraea sp.]